MASGGKKRMESYRSEHSGKKVCSGEEPQNRDKSFVPREYQIEILESAMERNTIACLGTGTGKTFIAVMLIREMAHLAQKPFAEGGKRIFFLVPTVPLVQQQSDVITKHTELKVGLYFGELNVDAWSNEKWQEEFEKHEVLVMTAEICRIILHHSFLAVSRICLLIFDECHQARGNSPYCEIMRHIASTPDDKPRILGLTASLLNGKCKPSKLEKVLKSLETTLYSTIETASDYNDVQKYGTDPDEMIVMHRELSALSNPQITVSDILRKRISETLEYIDIEKTRLKEKFKNEIFIDREELDSLWFYDDAACFFRKPYQCISQLERILEVFGPWGVSHAAEMYSKEIEKVIPRFDSSDDRKELYEHVMIALSEVINICKFLDLDSLFKDLRSFSHKLQRFLAVFRAFRKFENSVIPLLNPTSDITFELDPVAYFQYLKENIESEYLPSRLCSIVFVEQRLSSYVLCEWIRKIGQNIAEFSFMKPEFVVGHGTTGSAAEIKESAMSVKQQKQKVKDFRERKCNILVATSVIEEGMDIQKCNLVVRFDLPKDFRSYVQSKGRARAQDSKYVLLVSETAYDSFIEDLCNFKTVEDVLMLKCHNREMPSEDEFEEHMLLNELIPPYKPETGIGSPRITAQSAIGLLNRYCAKLPCDMAAKLKPIFLTKVVANDDSRVKEYICRIKLPKNCPLRKDVQGMKMKRKRHAKMSAALEVCKLLHEIGEFDDHLLPSSNAVDIAASQELGAEEEEVSETGAQPGTKRRRQLYKKKVADVLRNGVPKANEPCYLHIFLLDLVVPLAKSLNPRGRPIVNPGETTQGFGLLCANKLPRVCKFPIFTKVGKILVDILTIDSPVILTQTQVQKLSEFHRFIFADVLWLENKEIKFCPDVADCSYYIVPVNKGSQYYLDWEIVEYTAQHEYHNEKRKCKDQVKCNEFKESLFEDAVVTRTYVMDTWAERAPLFYYVNKIHHELTPCHTFEGNPYSNFKEYYRNKYNIDIQDSKQPVLEVEDVRVFNFFKPLYTSEKEILNEVGVISKSKLKHKNFRMYLIPELCLVHPFSSRMFRKATYIPTVMFRLNQLLLTESLRQSVAASSVSIGQAVLHSDFHWPVFNFEQSDKKLRSTLMNKGEIPKEESYDLRLSADISKNGDEIKSFQVTTDLSNHTGPNPSCLLQALTTTSAADEFDLERLEMIGDSFLKYAISVKLYVKYPTFDEGKLTDLRMRLIRNLNLYQKAKRLQLPLCLAHTPFDCRRTWLPPCYMIEEDYIVIDKAKEKGAKCKAVKTAATEGKEQAEAEFFYTFQLIPDKCVADSVEALIGAYLLSCGYQAAVRFMHWLGISPYPDPGEDPDFFNWPPVANSPSPIVECYLDHPDRLNLTGKFLHLQGFSKFENRIGYKFKEPAYLFQAFTHASYYYNEITDCYQRLEFLGDAILDYLVTRKLYDDPIEHTPGELTDLRIALVNNNYFASLAVKYGYHKNIKNLSVTLHKQLDGFIALLEDSEDYKYFEEYGYYLEEIECFELEEVEVPKALGDLFESVAGAIYLDSEMSLDAVWKVYYPMMKPTIDRLCKHVPKSPVRELFEMVNDHEIFDRVEKRDDKTYVHVKLPNGEEVVGVGPNKRVAKRSAAKRAVCSLRKSKTKSTASNSVQD